MADRFGSGVPLRASASCQLRASVQRHSNFQTSEAPWRASLFISLSLSLSLPLSFAKVRGGRATPTSALQAPPICQKGTPFGHTFLSIYIYLLPHGQEGQLSPPRRARMRPELVALWRAGEKREVCMGEGRSVPRTSISIYLSISLACSIYLSLSLLLQA